jgi:hypothetical protein
MDLRARSEDPTRVRHHKARATDLRVRIRGHKARSRSKDLRLRFKVHKARAMDLRARSEDPTRVRHHKARATDLRVRFRGHKARFRSKDLRVRHHMSKAKDLARRTAEIIPGFKYIAGLMTTVLGHNLHWMCSADTETVVLTNIVTNIDQRGGTTSVLIYGRMVGIPMNGLWE